MSIKHSLATANRRNNSATYEMHLTWNFANRYRVGEVYQYGPTLFAEDIFLVLIFFVRMFDLGRMFLDVRKKTLLN